MKKPSEETKNWEEERAKIIGLGERSARKNYYPQLKARISELERFKSLIEAASNLFILLNGKDLVIMDANKTARDIFGLSSPLGPSNHLFDLSSGHNILHYIESQTLEDKRFEINIDTVEGDRIDLLIDFRWVEIDGMKYGLLEGRNISERKRAEEKLQEARDTLEERVKERTKELEREIEERRQIEIALRKSEEDLTRAKLQAEEANRAKSEFLSSMSHELRTPLNGILGFAQLFDFQSDSPLAPKQRDYIDQIQKSGKHLLELINEILDLAKIEAGKVRLNLENIRVGEIIDDSLDLFEPLLVKYDVRLEAPHNAMERRHYITADPMRLRQVLINLLSNAAKYNKEKGRISFQLEAEAEFICFEISDSGIGIKKDDLEKLFTPFDRLGEEGSNVEGTGIGLTITARLVELMGGRIEVNSEPGVGSTFKVFIPKARQKEMSSKDHDQTHSNDKATKAIQPKSSRILYIEDTPANVLVMQELLTQIPNVIFQSAPTGEVGIAMIESQAYDLILVDINLPGMNGFDVVKKIKEIRPCPVIALSANAMKKDIEKGLSCGFDDYLTKPLDLRKTIDKITAILFDSDHS